ncbi:thioredoxin-like protein [Laetiporus sulphureus 93-53]|uniref:Thioredoxin-like protein n=1 Tax=Laetiporus sulphureus 93-53 TaxID=1314785 RepID=A0A165GTV8_9APHY|nr:thioredoxin-like protein [Laetiporus sulphureus 93-53]KZT10805.1 thioredoxin-like protein [Laetiporus sulphureus 93-53]
MATSYRRRRIFWSIVLLTAALLFYVSTLGSSPLFSLPESLKDLGYSPSSSRAGQMALAKLKAATWGKSRAREIDALLHFVTQYPERRLNEDEGHINVKDVGRVMVDPEKTVDLSVYAPDGEINWEAYVRVLQEENPVVVFSKTYCPYSQRAKSLLQNYELYPPPVVVELNTRSDGPIIQKILARLTGRRTVPNVLLHGKSLGGSDDIHLLHDEHQLKGILEEGGLQVNGAFAGLQVNPA